MSLFGYEEEESCYKLVRVSNFLEKQLYWIQSNRDRNKALSTEEHNLKESDM